MGVGANALGEMWAACACFSTHAHPARNLDRGGAFCLIRQLRRIMVIMLNLICNDYNDMKLMGYDNTSPSQCLPYCCHNVDTFSTYLLREQMRAAM